MSKKTSNTDYKALSKFFRSLNSTLVTKLIMNKRKLFQESTSSSFKLMRMKLFQYGISLMSTLKTHCFLNSGEYSDTKNYNPTCIFHQLTIHRCLNNHKVIPGKAHKRKLQLPQTSLWLSQMDFQEHLTQVQEHTSVSGTKNKNNKKSTKNAKPRTA